MNRVTGQRSSITAHSIIAIKGKAMAMKAFSQVPPLNNRELFHRDRQICAYCAGMFPIAQADARSRDAVLARRQGHVDELGHGLPRLQRDARAIARRSRRAWSSCTCPTCRTGRNT